MRKKIEGAGLKLLKDELIWEPKDTVMVTDLEAAQKIIKLNDALEADDDVVRVTNNVDFSEELLPLLG